MDFAFLLGQLFFGGFFLLSGINHFRHAKAMAGYAASKHVPAPLLAVLGSGVLIAVGGASVLFGVRPKLGLLPIALFLACVTPVMHAYWSEQDPTAKAMQKIQFGKNVALLGATLLLWSLY